MVPTRHEHEYLRRTITNLFPGHGRRVLSFLPEFIYPSCDPDHFWYPVSARIDGIKPLHAKNARSRTALIGYGGNFFELAEIRGDPGFGRTLAAGGDSYIA